MEYHSGGSLPLLGRPRYCPGAKANGGYLCETGHCCGESGCCTYYYELWWFWLLWTVLILFSCCCAYRHRRAKLRAQQQQRQREISLLAYHGASSYPSSMLDLSFLASLKLPSYEEVAAQPSTPPPPYSSVFTTPRYPQPPRASDPHLLTQHGPLLHRRLSDGPSSFSSDNSSSCSCDSCCPSSPCSSSISAPVTYETDTSHATTPSEAAPLTLEVTVETLSAAATRLEVSDAERTAVDDEDAAGARGLSAAAPRTADSLSSVSEVAPPAATTSPMMQPDSAPSSAAAGCNPSINRTSTGDPADAPRLTPALKLPLTPGGNVTSAPCSEGGRTCAAGPHTPDLNPVPARSTPGQASVLIPTDVTRSPQLLLTSLTPPPEPSNLGGPNPGPGPPMVPDSPPDPAGTSSPALPPSTSGQTPDLSPGSVLVLGPAWPRGGRTQDQRSEGCAGPLLALSHWSLSDPASPSTPHARTGPGSGSESGPCSTVSTRPGPQCPPAPPAASSSCPSITIVSESSALCQPPPVTLSLSPPPSPSSPPPSPSPPPPALCSVSLPAPVLLLDPLTVPHQSNKGGSSSGHASSLSPSPRATQSPPKQTLFSPCVDVFEPGPPGRVRGEEEEEEEDNDEDDEDMEADESQYKHRRLTGDSGIEVCRCRVEEEEEEEERKRNGRRETGGEAEKFAGGNPNLHDSVDCPVRSQVTTGEVTICSSTPTTTPPPEDGGNAVIVMETV